METGYDSYSILDPPELSNDDNVACYTLQECYLDVRYFILGVCYN